MFRTFHLKLLAQEVSKWSFPDVIISALMLLLGIHNLKVPNL